MATTTYTPIETYTLGSAAASVTFGSGNTLPQTYTDLVIVVQGTQQSSYSARNMGIRFNGDSGSNYSAIQILNVGSGSDPNLNNIQGPFINSSTNTTSGADTTAIINVQNYSNSTMYKIAISKGGTGAVYTSGGSNVGTYVGAQVGTWRNTAPVTEITLYAVAPHQAGSGANWSAGSTFTLYGISNADSSNTTPKATGGIITSDATYWYHTFKGSNTFTPLESLTADILVVAGGGGTSQDSGGGGAGGLLTFTSQSLTAQAYPVLVGAGGVKASANGVDDASSGGDSKFGTLTTCIGGGRARYRGQNPTGGSGAGGNSYNGGGTTTPASGTSGQGYAGGSADFCTGGGGGAGGVGGNASGSSIGGTGGIGATSSLINAIGAATSTGELSGGNYYYAGGGGGWYGDPAGGLGGGGKGSAPNGLANTGGGGAGYYGNGGSGIVVVRYAK